MNEFTIVCPKNNKDAGSGGGNNGGPEIISW